MVPTSVCVCVSQSVYGSVRQDGPGWLRTLNGSWLVLVDNLRILNPVWILEVSGTVRAATVYVPKLLPPWQRAPMEYCPYRAPCAPNCPLQVVSNWGERYRMESVIWVIFSGVCWAHPHHATVHLWNCVFFKESHATPIPHVPVLQPMAHPPPYLGV